MSTAEGEGTVQAAGGVVVQRGSVGLEVVLVHRPKYGDWSLPKGKLEAGESHLEAALREVEEETGLACRAGRELATLRYRDRRGRPKEVRFWHMEPLSGRAAERRPDAEVDEVRWLPRDEALALLSYESERRLLASATAPPGTP